MVHKKLFTAELCVSLACAGGSAVAQQLRSVLRSVEVPVLKGYRNLLGGGGGCCLETCNAAKQFGIFLAFRLVV